MAAASHMNDTNNACLVLHLQFHQDILGMSNERQRNHTHPAQLLLITTYYRNEVTTFVYIWLLFHLCMITRTMLVLVLLL